jgi:hypothetical protein
LTRGRQISNELDARIGGSTWILAQGAKARITWSHVNNIHMYKIKYLFVAISVLDAHKATGIE